MSRSHRSGKHHGVDEEKVQAVIAAKMRPKLEKTKNYYGNLITEGFALGMATAALGAVPTADVLDISPEVRKKQKTYQESVEAWQALVKMKVSQGRRMSKGIRKLAALEFVTATNTGSKVLESADAIDGSVDDVNGLLDELAKIGAEIPFAKDDEQFDEFGKFGDHAGTQIEAFSLLLTTASRDAQEMIEHEAVKAWVKKHPDKASKALDVGLKVVDQVLNGADYVAEQAELTGISAPASKAAKLTVSLLQAGKAGLDKLIKSVDAERQIKGYNEKFAGGIIFDEHNKDTTLFAEMLAEKYQADIKLALAVATPLAAAIPVISDIWDVVKTLITSAAKKYFEERMAKAKERAGLAADPEKSIVEEFTGNFIDGIKDNIFSVANPRKLLKDAAAQVILDKFLEKIMAELPIEPAQLVDGDRLRGEISDIASSFVTEFHVKGAGGDKPKYDFPRPEQDRRGRKIESILSEVREDDDGNPYQLVRIGGKVGALYRSHDEHEDCRFRTDDHAPELDPVDKILMQFMPTTDSLGRAIDEVDIKKGLRQGAEGGAEGGSAVSGNAAYWARIGDVWGYVDKSVPHKFWPRKPDPSAMSSWAGRKVDHKYYKSADGEVRGDWYKPWKDKLYYLFVKADGGREWAHGADLTANRGKTTLSSIMEVLGTKLPTYDNL